MPGHLMLVLVRVLKVGVLQQLLLLELLVPCPLA
jgi:hypothetical protein